jgi:hypothetical protein
MGSALIRMILNQEEWERIAPELPGKIGDPGATASDNRLFVEAVLWIAAPARRGVICRAPSANGTASVSRGVENCPPSGVIGVEN